LVEKVVAHAAATEPVAPLMKKPAGAFGKAKAAIKIAKIAPPAKKLKVADGKAKAVAAVAVAAVAAGG
jgi:hypothetical protein